MKYRKKINLEELMKLTNLADNYSASDLVDHSLAKNDGTITNAIHTSQGKYQSAMYFNGSDQYIDIIASHFFIVVII